MRHINFRYLYLKYHQFVSVFPMSISHFSIPIIVFLFLSVYVGTSSAVASHDSPVTSSVAIYNGPSYSSNISKLVNLYIAPRFNTNNDLMAQGLPNDTRMLGDLGPIYFENGTEALNSTANTRFEVDCCSWKAGWGLIDNPPSNDTSMGYQVLHAMSNLNATLGWHPNWVDDSVFGVPIPYRTNNTSIAYTLPNGSYPELSNGVTYQVAQHSPYSITCHCWNSPDMNYKRQLNTITKGTASAETDSLSIPELLHKRKHDGCPHQFQLCHRPLERNRI